MTRLLTAAALAALATAGPAAAALTYPDAVLATDPLAHLRLSSPDAGSEVGGYTTAWGAGVTSGAGAPLASDPGNTGASFNAAVGSNQGILTGLAGMTPGTASIAAWVNLSELPSASGRIFSIAGQSQFGNDLDTQFFQNVVSLCTGGGGGTCADAPLETSTLVGRWHFFVGTYDGRGNASTDFQRIYWDGALLLDAPGDRSASGHTSPFAIGFNTVFGGREFRGLIDEVALWDRALTSAEVADLYAARSVGDPPPPPPPVDTPAPGAFALFGLAALGLAARRR